MSKFDTLLYLVINFSILTIIVKFHITNITIFENSFFFFFKYENFALTSDYNITLEFHTILSETYD